VTVSVALRQSLSTIYAAAAAAVATKRLAVSAEDAESRSTSSPSRRKESAGEVTVRREVYRSDCHSAGCRPASGAAKRHDRLHCSVEPFQTQPVLRRHHQHQPRHRLTTGNCYSSEISSRCSPEQNCLSASNYHRLASDQPVHIHHLTTKNHQ